MSKQTNIKGIRFFNKMRNELKSKKMDFVTERTNSAGKIVYELAGEKQSFVFSDERTPYYVMNLSKQLKKEVAEKEQIIEGLDFADNPFDIEYFDFSKSLTLLDRFDYNTTFENVLEADIVGAYYRAALNLGLISQTTFNECMNLPKKYRLRALGSIATVKIIDVYEKGKHTESYKMQDDNLRKAWFVICSYVAETMQTLANSIGSAFMFYWVDGIYIDLSVMTQDDIEIMKKVEEELKKNFHFEWKLTRLKKITIKTEDKKIEIRVEKPSGEITYFYPPKRAVKYLGFGEEEFLKT